jgi:hypothetical protein
MLLHVKIKKISEVVRKINHINKKCISFQIHFYYFTILKGKSVLLKRTSFTINKKCISFQIHKFQNYFIIFLHVKSTFLIFKKDEIHKFYMKYE